MRQMWVWMLVTLALVNNWSHSCWVEEKIGLLGIKDWINHPNGSSQELENWADNKYHDADCCEWNGVVCDATTSRVVEISLESARDSQSFVDLCLNASLFLPFKKLKTLSLSSNGLVGCCENQGFEVLASGLKKLEELDLSYNRFNDSVLPSLKEISSLKSLDLSMNMLTGRSTSFKGFEVLASGLKKLEELDLRSNNFNDSVLPTLKEISSLKSLDLSWNMLTGRSTSFKELYYLTNLQELRIDGSSLPINILQSIGAFSALKVLSLRDCDLNGTLPTQGLCELKKLEHLDLSGNNLGGSLPSCLGNLSSLRLLDLSHNQFRGNIGFSPLSSLTSLEHLSLSSNRFEIPISFKSFMNHSNLKSITCDHNKLIADPTFQNFIPKFQLNDFRMSNCSSKALNAEIPSFLYDQYDLRVLDLSQNGFSGTFPSWLFENNTRLERLYLGDNSFAGLLQMPGHPNPNLSTIHISNNNIQGQIPKNMCLKFPNLRVLRMAKNDLTALIPYCFGNMSFLEFLDLSNNQLSGGMPEQFQLTFIGILDLSNNNLDGEIYPLIFNSSGLGYLYLNGNNFGGKIWDFPFIDLPSLWVLDISDNHLTGKLPRWIGNMSSLQAIDFSTNRFEGPIPTVFSKLNSLQFLDLSDNSLSGIIPPSFNQQWLSHVHFSKNQLTGPLPHAFYNSSFLVTLDLGYNNLTGPIPNWTGKISTLSVLVLKANYFDGELHSQLCSLQQLSILDLSQNKFSGPLPSCLGNLTFRENSAKTLVGRMMSDGYDEYSLNFPDEIVAFTTKRNSLSYKGDILNFMSGVDLSSNRFTGEIPAELGNLREIRALNLSHNNLTESIPATFSNLKQIESLDLSCNNLNGGIPPQLTQLTTLEVFSVAYNNLSGKTPDRKNQFGTFEESSYEGNHLFCGPPLQKSCSETESPFQPVPNDSNGAEDNSFIDMDVFYWSFGVCYIIVVLTVATVLYINPYWRRRWFYFIEECIDNCYYFVFRRS